MKFNYKSLLPYSIVIAVFAIITLYYFKPLLNGKELRQHDIAMHRGMSKEIADFREKNNAEPLWTNSMFGGMPAYQISTKYPGNWLDFFEKLFKLFLPHPGGYLFLYALGFFILLLCLDINVWLAGIGAIAYSLSTYFLSIIQAGHNSKANALGYLPALIGGIILIFRERYWLGLSIASMFTALELNANHVQIAYYGYMVIGFILVGFFIDAIKQKAISKFMKGFGFFLVASLIGVLPNAGNLMTTNEYGKLSNRGKAELTINSDMSSNKNILSGGLDKDYATNWSYGISESFSFLIPSFKGGGNNSIGRVDPSALKKVDPEYREMVSNSDVYFGDQPGISAPDYAGAIIILFAVFGMILFKNPIKWPLIIVTVLATALSWGHNFMPLTSFFMDYIPGYNKFRAVSMIMIIPELTLPLFAILGLNYLIKIKSWNEIIPLRFFKNGVSLKKLFIIVTSVVGGFCLISYIMPDVVNTFHSQYEQQELLQRYVKGGYPENEAKQVVNELMPQLESARKAIFQSDAFRSLVFILLAALVIFMYFTKKIKQEILLGSLALFVFIDLFTVDRRYLNDKSFVSKQENAEYISGKSAADEEILKDTDLDYRVLNLTVGPFDDASTSYYHKSIGGYHGAKLRRYVDLIDFHIRPELNIFYKNLNEASKNDSSLNEMLSHLEVLNMMNTKYFIIPVGEEGRSAIPLKNKMANGNAWFVSKLISASSPDSEIVMMRRFNSKTEAVINQKFMAENKLKTNYEATGEIKLIEYAANNLKYQSQSASNQFAVFSEIFYKDGWKAFVDGKETEISQVNYVLRGMEVPAGKHSIEFKFEPSTYYTGNKIAMVGSILLLISVGLGLYLNTKTKVS